MPEIHLPEPPLTDGELLLRAPRTEDVPVITAACQDPEVSRFTRIPSPYTESHAHQWMLLRTVQMQSGGGISFLIAAARDDSVLGSAGLLNVHWEHLRAEIGYWVAPWARRRGVAVRAVRLLSRWGFDVLRLARIELLTHPENRGSQRVAERCGYTREGVLRSYEEIRGKRTPLVLYSLLPDDPMLR